jgi:hypothetical protein
MSSVVMVGSGGDYTFTGYRGRGRGVREMRIHQEPIRQEEVSRRLTERWRVIGNGIRRHCSMPTGQN